VLHQSRHGRSWGSAAARGTRQSREQQSETGNQPGFLRAYRSEGFSCVGALLSNKKVELPVQSLSLRWHQKWHQ